MSTCRPPEPPTTGEVILVVDYVEIVHPDTLEPLEKIETCAVMALAVSFSKARLIDNALLEIA